MKDILESIKAKRKEADLLYKTLDMWNDVSGLVDPDSVECFGFDPKLLTPAQLREATGPAGYHGNHSPQQSLRMADPQWQDTTNEVQLRWSEGWQQGTDTSD